MKLVKVTLTGEEHSVLRDLTLQTRAALPAGGSVSEGSVLAALVRRDLAQKKEARQKEADRLVRQFEDAWMAFAARSFRKLRGAIPIEELQSFSFEEARKAALRYDATTGNSPASFIKGWLELAIRGFIRDHFSGGVPEWVKVIYPDGDHGEEDRSKWESIGQEDRSLAGAPERSELRAALASFIKTQDRKARRIVKLLASGEGDDQIVERLGINLDEVERVRRDLALHLKAAGLDPQADEELTVAAAAVRFNLPVKKLHKALSAGQLEGRKVDGAWRIRVSSVRGLARALAAKQAAQEAA